MFTRLLPAILLVAAAGAVNAQALRPQTSSYQHVTAVAGASAPDVAQGGSVSLWADVTPKSNIHVYAPGARDFQPPALVVTPNRLIAVGKPVYPAGTPMTLPGVQQRVPVYNKTFRVTQPVVIPATAPRGTAIIIAATLNYQACDDAVCYPPASLPLFWRITVK